MTAPVVLHDVVLHCGRSLRARVLCDVWMYTDSDLFIPRGDTVALVKGDGVPVYYVIEQVLATNGAYQKFRVAKLPPIL